ncbi:MAG: hypothetical protein AAB569_01800 [Patescibacteria group bacterium]
MNSLTKRLIHKSPLAHTLGQAMIALSKNLHLLPQTKEGQQTLFENFGSLCVGASVQMEQEFNRLTSPLPRS